MAHEFEERRDAPYPQADPLDREAMRFVKSWHRYPPLHDALWYRGVNLGEANEYLLFQEVMSILLEREKRQGK